MGKVIVGQEQVIEEMLIGLLSGGHCLITGAPGLAKTLLVKTVAQVFSLSFHRIQFTPDLMPSDITGTEILEETENGRELVFNKGPIFANMILADEINRTPPKTQAALLEAMQEHQVTVAGHSLRLEEPFFVLATQNPIEMEGTYPLPEAQLDRFMLKVHVGYPTREEERSILDSMATSSPRLSVDQVVGTDEIIRARGIVNDIYVDDRVKDYIVNIVWATRDPASAKLKLDGMIRYGASPRATIFLTLAAKANAFIAGRGYVTPQDVKGVGLDILRHRIGVSYEAEAESITTESVVEQIFAGVPVP